MDTDLESRPVLGAQLDGAELRRWYWTADELAAFARSVGLGTGGGKQALSERIAAWLDGVAEPEPGPRPRSAAGRQLREPLDRGTVIPPGQRSGQVLRAFFQREIGPGFHFDGFMREFIATGAGRTLGDAVDHWWATRESAAQPREIGTQFELNRFLRDWHRDNPDQGREAAMAAWRRYRALPADRR